MLPPPCRSTVGPGAVRGMGGVVRVVPGVVDLRGREDRYRVGSQSGCSARATTIALAAAQAWGRQAAG